MVNPEDERSALELGAREVRWAPRVPLHKIRRLYETDALGIVDDEQIDDVGYALLARCTSVIDATAAHHKGLVRCPRSECRSTLRRRGRPDRPEDRNEVIRCAACGWATTERAYDLTYRGRQLLGANAMPAFESYRRDFERATGPQHKMLAIDRLIHAIHGDLAQGWVGRPAAVNVLQGTIREIFALLDGLAYGIATTPGLEAGHAAWLVTRRAAPRLSRIWRSDEDAESSAPP